jgi:hypothetical protein
MTGSKGPTGKDLHALSTIAMLVLTCDDTFYRMAKSGRYKAVLQFEGKQIYLGKHSQNMFVTHIAF